MTDQNGADLWRALQEALAQDFVDSLPSPLSALELARLLHLPKEAIHRAIARGVLVATIVDGAWVVDARASMPYLRRAIGRISIRRRERSEQPTDSIARSLRVMLTERSVELLAARGVDEPSAAAAIEHALEASCC